VAHHDQSASHYQLVPAPAEPVARAYFASCLFAARITLSLISRENTLIELFLRPDPLRGRALARLEPIQTLPDHQQKLWTPSQPAS
jgi:hypothetical protein